MFRYTNYALICIDEHGISHGNDLQLRDVFAEAFR